MAQRFTHMTGQGLPRPVKKPDRAEEAMTGKAPMHRYWKYTTSFVLMAGSCPTMAKNGPARGIRPAITRAPTSEKYMPCPAARRCTRLNSSW